MDELTLQFFDAHPGALPLYEAFKTCVTDLVPDVRIKVQKTQISFYNRHLFACVSFARIRKKKNCPDNYIKDAELFLRELKGQGYLLVIASTTRKTGSRSTGLRIIRSGIMQKPLCCCITGNRPYRLSKKGNSI